jgi:2-iminobutanoate/2-iminopropanoate deaminase
MIATICSSVKRALRIAPSESGASLELMVQKLGRVMVTVTKPGKFIFLAGIGPEREGDGKIVHEGDFLEQCRYAYMEIKKLLDLQGATMNDVVRIMTYTTDVRFFQDALKCRGEAFGNAPIPASTFLVVSQLAWPNMAIEVDVTAMLAK